METFREAFNKKHPGTEIVCDYFELATGVNCVWENFTKRRLQEFVDFLRSRMAPNGANTYISKFKTVLNMYNEEIVLPKDYEKVLSSKKDASQHVYLNEEEIQRILEYDPESESEWCVRNQFLIGCLTGARHSDYILFTSKNFFNDSLKYVSIKTHHDTEVPLSPAVRRLILENEEHGFIGNKYSDVYFNRLIKNICRKVGINNQVTLYCFGKFSSGEKWQYISSHTARRSFASNLYNNGVDIYTISCFCGHSNVEMTKTYICCQPKPNEIVLQYFNKFS